MKHLSRITALVIVTSAGFIACSKSDSNSSKTKAELITEGSWKFDHATASGIGDVSGAIPNCYKDNVVVFVSGGTGNISEGTDVCSPSTAGNFTWSSKDNDATLSLSTPLFTGGSGDFTLVSLTETNLIISQMMTIAPYPSTNVEVTFKH